MAYWYTNLRQDCFPMLPDAMSGDPIRAYVLDGIASGTLKPQQKLPTERQLADQFGRPRSAVRKTLMILEAEGRIVRHVGRGTFVTQQSAPPVNGTAMLVPDTSPSDLIEARLVFEPNLAPLIASNATSADFRKMADCLEAAAAAKSLEEYEAQDDAFHLAIAQATHNSLLIRTAEMLSTARHDAAWGFLKERRGTFKPMRRTQVRAQHLAILDAIRERDVDATRQLLLDHLLDVRQNLLGR